MLQAINLAKHFGSQTLFTDLSWQVQKGDRMGLVGPNGAGKTTLMRILMGQEHADGGQVTCARDETLGYLPQEAPRATGTSVIGRVLTGAETVRALERDLEAVQQAMAHATGQAAADLAARHAELEERYRLLDGYTLEARAKEILGGLGFSATAMEQPIDALSGGWWMRVELARLLLLRPDFLLLDEPTNHLDFASLEWLEGFLESYQGAWVVVSHDRYFLNRMVTSIAELSADGLFVFPGNYDDYCEARAELAMRLEQEARAHAKRVAEISSFIERFRAKATKARQAQSRVKLLERMEPPPSATPKRRTMRLQLPTPKRAGDTVLTLQNVGKRYGDKVVYDDLTLSLRRGDKIALVGANGAGKSTLLKMLAGVVEPDKGTRQLGHNVDTYYFAQHQLDVLVPEHTVLEEMQAAMPQESLSRVRGILGAFLFSNDTVDKKVSILSGGEKTRLVLAKMLSQPANLLLMDEPTNHLDLASRDVLEEALAAFEGTVVVISHDRYFINRIANKVIYVHAGGQVDVYPGDYDYFIWKQHQETKARTTADIPTGQRSKSAGARDYEARKAAQREEAKRAKEAARLEAAIHSAEDRMRAIDALLCDPTVYNNVPRCKDLLGERQSLQDSLPDLYEQWESAAG